MKILVTGGAGFIGSHTLIELVEAGHAPVVVDNLSNSSPKAIERVEKIVGKTIPFYNVDIRDREGLEKVFAENTFDCCIHFAGLKAVGESVQKPWEYYENNIGGTLVLVDVMRKHGCKNIIFSSSATVYGAPETMPITEDCPKGTVTNPYGWTKYMLEQVLSDIQKADPEWNVVLLRYFNPIGAHKSGTIGEDPNGIPNNLMPYITQVAVGKLPQLGVFGNDYPTHDGTGVRDYIWPRAMSARSRPLPRSAAWASTTWAPVRATASWIWSRPSRLPPASRSPMSLSPGAAATWPSAGPIPPRLPRSWAGRPSTAWRRCARTPGAGRRTTPTVTATEP